MLTGERLQVILNFFDISLLHELIGKKFRIQYSHENIDDELIDNEVCFLVTGYANSGGCIEFAIPLTSFEGEDENCVLVIFENQASVQFAISVERKGNRKVIYDSLEKTEKYFYFEVF